MYIGPVFVYTKNINHESTKKTENTKTKYIIHEISSPAFLLRKINAGTGKIFTRFNTPDHHLVLIPARQPVRQCLRRIFLEGRAILWTSI